MKIYKPSERALRRRIDRAALMVSQQRALIAQLEREGLPTFHAARYMREIHARLDALSTSLPESETTLI